MMHAEHTHTHAHNCPTHTHTPPSNPRLLCCKVPGQRSFSSVEKPDHLEQGSRVGVPDGWNSFWKMVLGKGRGFSVLNHLIPRHPQSLSTLPFCGENKSKKQSLTHLHAEDPPGTKPPFPLTHPPWTCSKTSEAGWARGIERVAQRTRANQGVQKKGTTQVQYIEGSWFLPR